MREQKKMETWTCKYCNSTRTCWGKPSPAGCYKREKKAGQNRPLHVWIKR